MGAYKSKLSRELYESQKLVGELEYNIAENMSDLNNDSSNEDIRSEIERLEADLGEALRKQSILSKDKESLIKVNNVLETEKKALSERIIELESTNSIEDLESLRREYNILNASLKASESENVSLKEVYESSLKRIHDLTNDLHRIKTEYVAYREQTEKEKKDLKANLNILEHKLQRVTTEKKNLIR